MASSAPNPVTAEERNIQTGPSHYHPQQPLQCPRCSSSNTKFCYYNNYSLSQPRHFCKACKRYWTRGGTLRNVPVGGGCRRNMRPKRPPPPSLSGGGDGTPPAAQSPRPNPKINNSPPSLNRTINNPSLFYGGIQASNNLLEPLNFPFSGLCSSRFSDENPGFDFQPQINGFGFSSGHVNGPPLNWSLSPFSSPAANNSVLSGSSARFESSSTMASLLASTFQKQRFEFKGTFKDPIGEAGNGASGLMPYGGTPVLSHLGNTVTGNNDVKVEGDKVFGFGFGSNPIDHLNSSDPSPVLWGTNNLGAWSDPSNSNMGSSVSSLM